MARRKNHRVALEGAAELDRALSKLADRAQGELLEEAAQAGAEVIREEAARLAPRDTGLLAQEVADQPKRLQIGRAQIDVGPSKKAWYGRLLEHGTSKMAAQPFLRPAFEAKKDEAVEAMKRVLRRLLDGR